MAKRKIRIGCLAVLAVFVACATYMLAPALMRARRASWRAVCMSNLKQIGLGCIMYAVDYDEHYPNTLGELYASAPGRYVGLQCFFCPEHYHGRVPKGMKTFDEATVSYRLTPGLTTADDLDTVLACDKSVWNHDGDSMNLLFIDGHGELGRVNKMVERDFDKIAGGLSSFFQDKGRYPANEEGLEILVTSKYLKNVTVDPFDRDAKRHYAYATKNVENNWILTSYGPDEDRDIDLELYSEGKLSTEDLLKLKTKITVLGMSIKWSNGDIFRIGP